MKPFPINYANILRRNQKKKDSHHQSWHNKIPRSQATAMKKEGN